MPRSRSFVSSCCAAASSCAMIFTARTNGTTSWPACRRCFPTGPSWTSRAPTPSSIRCSTWTIVTRYPACSTLRRGAFAKSARLIPSIDRKSTRLNSSHLVISYAVFCLEKKNDDFLPMSQPCVSDFNLVGVIYYEMADEFTPITPSAFFFNDTATTEIYTLSLHDALPISRNWAEVSKPPGALIHNMKASPPRSEEHTSELQSPCNLVCRLLLEKKKKRRPGSRPLGPRVADEGSFT